MTGFITLVTAALLDCSPLDIPESDPDVCEDCAGTGRTLYAKQTPGGLVVTRYGACPTCTPKEKK